VRRRLTLASTFIAILVALILPASTLAYSGINYSKEDNYCAGLNVHFTVKFWAAGNTTATKLTVDSWAQRAPSGGAWKTVKTWTRHTYSFAINGHSHWVTGTLVYKGKVNYYWYRIQMRLQAWHNSTRLKQYTVTSIHC